MPRDGMGAPLASLRCCARLRGSAPAAMAVAEAVVPALRRQRRSGRRKSTRTRFRLVDPVQEDEIKDEEHDTGTVIYCTRVPWARGPVGALCAVLYCTLYYKSVALYTLTC